MLHLEEKDFGVNFSNGSEYDLRGIHLLDIHMKCK